VATPTRSPLAPPGFPTIRPVRGVRLAAGAAGLRYKGRPDLLLVALAEGTQVGGVFAKSSLPGHPVRWCRRILPRGSGRGLVVNAGNANVLNGEAGDAAVRHTAERTAALIGIDPDEVYVASTGVIGEPLPVDRLVTALPDLAQRLEADGFERAAQAICTTDTFAKGSTAMASIGGHEVRIAGIAKGSGMIQPNMATMLAFVFTDARLPAVVLQALLNEMTPRTFGSITVDGDMSTSDTLLLFATGQSDHAAVSDPVDPALHGFRDALHGVLLDLAKQVVRDGEGASKFVQIRVRGADDAGSARRIAFSVANSPLVKTAIAGEDANWGRIAMAVGKSGEPVEPARFGIVFGGHPVAWDGSRVPDLDEAPVTAHLKGREIDLEIVVGAGPGAATVWTCDLTHDYIAINADYRS
jgi:glutamate N-acetyltransferase/amino-acid N-acetyltransferase